MFTLPFTLPGAYETAAGSPPITADVDTGGYDFLVGGLGFRLATNKERPYQRYTEAATIRRLDSSAEPGEQTLSELPWPRSQSTFHGGAGQRNLEQGRNSFQYQQEQVDHLRFDTCLGVDVWTPGEVKRLPDVRLYEWGFNSSCMVTATVNAVDYAIVGGAGGLYQVKWDAGPDADPTVTAIDLTGATFGGAANCNVASLATDGVRYFGVLQLTVEGSTAGLLTYIISGSITSVAEPTALYEVPGVGTASPRTNLCTNPSFEANLAGWVARDSGGTSSTITQSGVRAHSGASSCLSTSNGISAFKEGPAFTMATGVGVTYTASGWVWVSAGTPAVLAFASGVANGSTSTTTGAWERLSVTFTATATSTQIAFGSTPGAAGQTFWLDDVLIEEGATLGAFFDGSSSADASYNYSWTGTPNASTSLASPIAVGGQSLGVVGWVKARLIGCAGGKLYELDSNTAAHSALPTPKYSHPNTNWLWTTITESPDGILAAGAIGSQSSILQFTLDTTGGTPSLAGGQSVASFPPGEIVYTIKDYLSSFLAIGTSRGVRVGTFDTYSGALKYGPLAVETDNPVLALTGRDRFIYAGFTDQQADGKTGLVRIDLSMIVDSAGRNAYAPDLRPPTTAPTGLGTVTSVGQLPTANRLLFLTPEGVHVEGDGPGSDGDSWIRTSRIRYGTAEMKLFKLGRLHGSLDVANIQVTGITPYGADANLGTFGFVSGGDPGEFRLPTGLHEWIQLQFSLQGSACVLNSYQVKALPAPKRQHIILVTARLSRDEYDRYDLEVSDPLEPRDRLRLLEDLENSGQETRFVEFTNTGPVADLVVIEQTQFEAVRRPNPDEDFKGYLTIKMRKTES